MAKSQDEITSDNETTFSISFSCSMRVERPASPTRLRYNFIIQGDTTPGDTKLLPITKKWDEMTGKNDLIVVSKT